ncbi:MAG: metal transporter [Chlorobiaceae bacterium]|nr:metal transporter [Chlorobiaceae bacterium]MBA4308729.1 metal transporter [Chlorobiaceae bacterium]
MDFEFLLKIFTIIFFVCLTALFSISEVLFFRFSKHKTKELLINRPLLFRYYFTLVENNQRLFVTLSIGKIFGFAGTTIFGLVLLNEINLFYFLPESIILFVQIIFLASLLIIFAEVLPKFFANVAPHKLFKIIIPPLYWINIFYFPISELLNELIKSLLKKINLKNKNINLSNEELTQLAELQKEDGTLKEDEHELIESIVLYQSVMVKEIMRPRVDIVAVNINSTFKEVLEVITNTGHSRIPVFKNEIDFIVGILYAKDFLPYIENPKLVENFNIKNNLREPLFVPQTKLINNLMREFQDKKMHMAIVVDEYGGTSGLITLEDIIEEIIGEIRDEYEKDEHLIQKISSNSFIVSGHVTIDELNDILNIDLPTIDVDYETIGGFVLHNAGMIPKINFSFVENGFKFTVKEIQNKRIKKILLENINEKKLSN